MAHHPIVNLTLALTLLLLGVLVEGRIQNEWIHKGEHAYKVIKQPKHQDNHDKAKEICRQHKGILPEPRSPQENNYLDELKSEKFYLGMKKDNGKWLWESDGSAVSNSWNNWKDYKFPSNRGNWECTVMIRHHTHHAPDLPADGWSDYPCGTIWLAADVVCQTDVDQCSTNPCANGGVCTNISESVQCDCGETGYEGETCQDDIDECKANNTCRDGEICRNLPGSVECKTSKALLEQLDGVISNLTKTEAELADTKTQCGGLGKATRSRDLNY